MKRLNMYDDDDHLPYYPTIVPSVSSESTVFTVGRVVLSGSTPRLELYWQKSLQNIVGWRLKKALVANPAFVGDVNPFYLITSNLPAPSPNEGRFNTITKQILGTVMRPTNSPTVQYTVQEFTVDPTSWTRIKNYTELDNIYVELGPASGTPFATGIAPFWMVEIEFLTVINSVTAH